MTNATLKAFRELAECTTEETTEEKNWQLIDLKGRVAMFGLSCKEAAHYSNLYGYATRQAGG